MLFRALLMAFPCLFQALVLRGNSTLSTFPTAGSARDKAFKACFGDNYQAAGDSISHCFQEHDTHNTCCMLDKSARDQNDAHGNPIGQASLTAHRAIAGQTAEQMPDAPNLLTAWCTCFGSQVCSHYAQTTGTKIKFVNDCACGGGTAGKGFCMASINASAISGCEGWAREQFQMPGHSTPGVPQPADGENQCAQLQSNAEVDVSTCTM
eukprot:CAMPEP_0197660470 /NCGR_PEP_ID=MMETSP1338-20131121/50865_1 /TAXON_ID=43686 ORGANISM="Pelagodinium beii, Strain RCC1491" /NCGR_SAMPLE_ID=MMETSP1338 /ASSEMBLY_ACC=CAM_ASM_000754 /LENGTH=208 /DNA_ID=CAMNT_0043237823 /DNA_START=62 /DNA_END=688 /DNA_ORIENTATION=-